MQYLLEFFPLSILHEAWVRSAQSFDRSMRDYTQRVANGLQPASPFINFYDVFTQYNFVCWGNIVYLLITMALFSYMKKQPVGYRLRWVLTTFDGINVVAAMYVAVAIIQYKFSHGRKLVCNELNNDEDGHRIANIFVLFYIQKYFEFCDTWLFLLRKSFRQVTFLHLIYHSSITVVVGALMPFDYNGDMFLPILLNCINHALIYGHYLLATFGVQSVWSSYITWMQFLQFVIIFAQSLVAYRIGPSCGSPDFAKLLMMVYMASMISLYGNYMMQRYVFRRPLASFFGVVKRPDLVVELSCSYCGTIALDDRGSCTILLPVDFPDEEQLRQSSTLPISLLITYSLTPMGCAMPNLHISKEIGRHQIQHRTLFKKSPAVKLTSSGNLQELEQQPMRLLVSVGQKQSSGERGDSAQTRERTYASLISSWENNPDKTPSSDRPNVVKSNSFSDFQSVHNDRIIDGPHGIYQQPAEGRSLSRDRRSKSNTALDEVGRGGSGGSGGSLSKERPSATAAAVAAAIAVASATATSATSHGLLRAPQAPSTAKSNPNKATLSSSSATTVAQKAQGTLPGTEETENSGSLKQIQPPFSFEVSGGVPSARVSWSIRVIPQRRRRRVDDQTLSSEVDRRFEDWRALS